MAMDLKEIESLIKEGLPDAKVEIQDLQHKMVYNSLKGKMGNELHALAIKTKEI